MPPREFPLFAQPNGYLAKHIQGNRGHNPKLAAWHAQ